MPPQEQQISSASLVQSDLTLSWNTGQGPFYWYRIQGECGDINCETMGVQSQSCPGLTYIATVAARSLEELCDILSNPKTTQPFRGKIASLKRYSRPAFKPAVETGDCNFLEEVEFCQVPECLDFCFSPAPFYAAEFRPYSVLFGTPTTVATSRDGDSVSSQGDFDFGFYVTETPILSHSDVEIMTESGETILATSDVPSPPSPGIVISGSSYVASTSFYFEGSGSVVIGGSIKIVKEHFASGSAEVSGSAEYNLNIFRQASGAIVLSGTSPALSPNYHYEASGLIEVTGLLSIISYFRNIGTIQSSMSLDSFAFDFGFEYIDDRTISALTISRFSVDACGCSAIGATVSLRHNLLSSEAFSSFLSSAGLAYPSTATLRYKSSESAWMSNDLIRGRNSNWSVLMSLQCQGDSWRLSFGVTEAARGTRMVLDIPSEIFCGDGPLIASVSAYFKPYRSDDGKGVKIDAVRPRKPMRAAVTGSMEAFANGIFLPQTLYYDELGLFNDRFWYGSPLELELDAPAKNGSALMDISWVV